MGIAAFPYGSFSGTILSAHVMANFDHLRNHYNSNAVETSGAQTIAGVKTFSAIPVFSAGISSGAVVTVTAGGIAVTGNSTITGTLGGLTGLTVASGGIAVTGNSTITGTLSGLTAFTLASGDVTLTNGNLALSNGQGYAAQYDAGNSGTSLTLDWNNSNVQKVTMTGNCTFTLSNPVTGACYVVRFVQDATGNRTITLPSTVKWPSTGAPSFSTAANRTDVITFIWNGTNYEAGVVGIGYNS